MSIVQKLSLSMRQADGSTTVCILQITPQVLSEVRLLALLDFNVRNEKSVVFYRYMRKMFNQMGFGPRFLELTGTEITEVKILEGLGAGSYIRFYPDGSASDILMIDENGERIPSLLDRIENRAVQELLGNPVGGNPEDGWYHSHSSGSPSFDIVRARDCVFSFILDKEGRVGWAWSVKGEKAHGYGYTEEFFRGMKLVGEYRKS